MNDLSAVAVSDFKTSGIISALLNPHSETTLSACVSAPRTDRTARALVMSIEEAAATTPSLLEALASHVSLPLAQLPALEVPQAFALDTSFLGTRVEGTDNHGLVLVLPEIFLSQANELSMQKPSVISALSADYLYAGRFFCWKSNQHAPTPTYDLWFSALNENLVDLGWLQSGPSQGDGHQDATRYCWTDVIVVCGAQVFMGGFWSDTSDGFDLQVAGHMTINYRAPRQWSADDLQEARERATSIGTIAPWEGQVCVSANGRRFRFVDELSKRAS